MWDICVHFFFISRFSKKIFVYVQKNPKKDGKRQLWEIGYGNKNFFENEKIFFPKRILVFVCKYKLENFIFVVF